MSRVKKTIKNAWVAIAMNILLLLLAFISRKVFIDSLGDNITGLNSTLSDILGFLNLAEMGVLAAIAYSLYKPLFENDRTEICNIMSILCYVYRIIGIFILITGVFLSLFLPMIFSGKGVDMPTIYIGYYTFLLVNLLSYFINYKQNILIADQRNWVIVSTLGFTNIVKIILQVIALKYTDVDLVIKYSLFLIIELAFGFAYSFIINLRVKKLYPWLRSSFTAGRKLRKEYTSIFHLIKQVFSHKFGNFILTQTDSLVISLISSTFTAVTIYTNYILIFSRLTRLCFSAFDNIGAGIGNLIAEGNSKSVYSTYKQLNAIFFLIAGIIVVCGYHLTAPFIRIWLGDGEKFIIDNMLFILILANIYISVIRRINELFLNAHGLFSDVWAPWSEAVVNLGISLVLGYKMGVIGVVIGTLISTLLIGVIWKPIFLYRKAFRIRSFKYYASALKFGAITLITIWATNLLISSSFISTPTTYTSWFVNAITITVAVSVMMLLMFYVSDSATRYVTRRAYQFVREKLRA
ncbi:MAG: sugar transporter [Rikenellaceae bacterium]